MSFDQIRVELCSHWGTDRDSANAAWASSYDQAVAQAKSDDDVRRVVAGLAQLHHDTPKERIWLEFFITCPIYVERQLDKYRMTQQFQDFKLEHEFGNMGRNNITQNELSGRYRIIPDRPYTVPDDVLKIGEKCDISMLDMDELTRIQHESYQTALNGLQEAREENVITTAEYRRAREVLRGLLGTAFLTDMRLVLNLNALEHILNQRLAPEAQLEVRLVAALMYREAAKTNLAPILLSEMVKVNGWFPLIEEIQVLTGIQMVQNVPNL